MSAEDLIYDILEIKNALEDDNDIDESWLLNKINLYRQFRIAADYAVNHEIKPVWLQRLRKQSVQKVTSADDPSIDITSIAVGKVTLPGILALPDDMGLNRVSGSAGILTYDQIDFDTMMMKVCFDEERMGEFGYCSRIGNDLYLYPYAMEIQAVIIAENPFDIPVMDATTKALRAMTVADPYPLDGESAQWITLEILTKDLNLNAQMVSDIVNDSQSQLKLRQNGAYQNSES